MGKRPPTFSGETQCVIFQIAGAFLEFLQARGRLRIVPLDGIAQLDGFGAAGDDGADFQGSLRLIPERPAAADRGAPGGHDQPSAGSDFPDAFFIAAGIFAEEDDGVAASGMWLVERAERGRDRFGVFEAQTGDADGAGGSRRRVEVDAGPGCGLRDIAEGGEFGVFAFRVAPAAEDPVTPPLDAEREDAGVRRGFLLPDGLAVFREDHAEIFLAGFGLRTGEHHRPLVLFHGKDGEPGAVPVIERLDVEIGFDNEIAAEEEIGLGSSPAVPVLLNGARRIPQEVFPGVDQGAGDAGQIPGRFSVAEIRDGLAGVFLPAIGAAPAGGFERRREGNRVVVAPDRLQSGDRDFLIGRRRGFKVHAEPACRVRHTVERSDFGGFVILPEEEFHRCSAFFHRENAGERRLFKTLRSLLTVDGYRRADILYAGRLLDTSERSGPEPFLSGTEVQRKRVPVVKPLDVEPAFRLDVAAQLPVQFNCAEPVFRAVCP